MPDPFTKTVIEKTAAALRAAEEDQLPTKIQGYDLLTHLGQGALGVVYRGTQLGTNRDVAIKCIRPELQLNDKVRQLFIREASIAAQLKHRCIVECLGFGFVESQPYLVMEYLPSEDLEQIAMRHSPSRRVRLAVKVVLQILEGLQYAHNKGFVHRDIKLSNILAYRVNKRLHIKIADFGLAKVFQTAGHSGITRSDELCGTVAYMSPEQMSDSRSAKPDSDLYSAIICLFRLLTGQFPYPAGTIADTMQRRLHENPRRVQELNPEVSDALGLVVDSGLSRFPQLRWRSGRRLIEALRQVPEMQQ